jgi:hypothetical protein
VNKNQLTVNLEDNINIINSYFPNNAYLKTRELTLYGNLECVIMYIDGLTDKDSMEKHIIFPLLFKLDTKVYKEDSPAYYISKRYISINSMELLSDAYKISEKLKRGQSLILIENDEKGIVCDTNKNNFKKNADPKIEENLKGGKSAFVENVKINTSMIQEKIVNDNLIIEQYIFGKQNKTESVLIYLDNIIDSNVLSKIKKELNKVDSDYIPDTGYLMKYIGKNKYCIFPQYKTVEKPDKAVSDIIQGKAVVFVNGCAYGVIIPTTFIDYFQSFEDYSNNIILANFDRCLRFMAVFIILLTSPLYLTLISYNIELIPRALINIIADSRKDIPLPPFLEIFVMELIIEFLREGGLRLPSKVGQTMSIIGGIILGQAAIESRLVSPATLVIISISVICTFLIPIYEMSLAIRLYKFIMLILAQILGLFGIIIGLYFIIAYLISLENYGVPYFLPLAPMKHRLLKDSIIRKPLKDINKMPKSIN